MLPLSDARSALDTHAVETDELRATGVFTFPSSLPVFAGHFPESPIVPGVYLLGCAQVLSEVLLNKPCQIREIPRVKWTAPLLPEQALTVTVSLTNLELAWRAKASFHHGETSCGSATIIFASSSC